MTLIVCWIGKDSRKTSSVYIAGDSRITWPGKSYDSARKVFAFPNSPDLLGYCGDVLFPTLILNQLIDMDREGILFSREATSTERVSIIFSELQGRFTGYPIDAIVDEGFEILHVSRQGETTFIANVYRWSRPTGWVILPLEIPDSSDKVIVLGTGEKEFYARYLDYYKSLNGKTSRALFQCLTHSLLKMKDLKCGGSPQLVGLYNRFNGRNFGVIYENKRYYLGKEVNSIDSINNIEWRNELFERCDGITMKVLNGAQRQPDVLRP